MQEKLDMLFLLEHFSLKDLVKAKEEYVNYEFRNTGNLTELYTEEKEFLDDNCTEFIITRDYYTYINDKFFKQ